MEVFSLTENTTTSSGRIFIKVLFQYLGEMLGYNNLKLRILDPELEMYTTVRNYYNNIHKKLGYFSKNKSKRY